jgi:predicted membrane-bound mannosyltransferase
VPVYVVTTPENAWPLPWYLRAFSAVGYWSRVQDVPPDNPPVMIVSPALEDSLTAELKSGYQTEYFGLRPGVLLALHIRQDLWSAFLNSR